MASRLRGRARRRGPQGEAARVRLGAENDAVRPPYNWILRRRPPKAAHRRPLEPPRFAAIVASIDAA